MEEQAQVLLARCELLKRKLENPPNNPGARAALLRESEEMLDELKHCQALNEAIGLAHIEKTGLELEDGGDYTRGELERAKEIVKSIYQPLFPKND